MDVMAIVVAALAAGAILLIVLGLAGSSPVDPVQVEQDPPIAGRHALELADEKFIMAGSALPVDPAHGIAGRHLASVRGVDGFHQGAGIRSAFSGPAAG